MELKFKVSGRIAKPVHDVFEAVADPKQLSSFFTTGGASARLERGTTVMWDFADFPGAFPVKVVEVEQDRRIVLQWGAAEGDSPVESGTVASDSGYDTTVTMTFEPLEDGRTLVSISEEGWRDTPGALKAAFGNCQGWTQMLCAMKTWVEHRINLRDGMYK